MSNWYKSYRTLLEGIANADNPDYHERVHDAMLFLSGRHRDSNMGAANYNYIARNDDPNNRAKTAEYYERTVEPFLKKYGYPDEQTPEMHQAQLDIIDNWRKEPRYDDIIKESEESEGITLYHGTCEDSAQELIKNGWQPNSGTQGGNMGQTRYLYCTTGYEDAQWFANEKGCDAIVKISNVPKSFLIVDPEDGVGDSVEDELSIAEKNGMPAKLALRHSLPSSYFSKS